MTHRKGHNSRAPNCLWYLLPGMRVKTSIGSQILDSEISLLTEIHSSITPHPPPPPPKKKKKTTKKKKKKCYRKNAYKVLYISLFSRSTFAAPQLMAFHLLMKKSYVWLCINSIMDTSNCRGVLCNPPPVPPLPLPSSVSPPHLHPPPNDPLSSFPCVLFCWLLLLSAFTSCSHLLWYLFLCLVVWLFESLSDCPSAICTECSVTLTNVSVL